MFNPNSRSSSSVLPSSDGPPLPYINALINCIRTDFLGEKTVPPVFYYEKDGELNPITVPLDLLDSDEGKEELSSLIKTAVKTFEPASHCFISEAWLYRLRNIADREEAKQVMQDFKNGIPSEKVVRQECVVIHLTKFEPDGKPRRWMGSIALSRGSDSKISSLDPVNWIEEKPGMNFEGRLI